MCIEVCENQKSALSYKPKEIFKDIKVKRANSLEKSMRMSRLEEGFGNMEIKCD